MMAGMRALSAPKTHPAGRLRFAIVLAFILAKSLAKKTENSFKSTIYNDMQVGKGVPGV
jgi:hypothetical protein